MFQKAVRRFKNQKPRKGGHQPLSILPAASQINIFSRISCFRSSRVAFLAICRKSEERGRYILQITPDPLFPPLGAPHAPNRRSSGRVIPCLSQTPTAATLANFQPFVCPSQRRGIPVPGFANQTSTLTKTFLILETEVFNLFL